jgi:peptidoglycan-associated lipoprotein
MNRTWSSPLVLAFVAAVALAAGCSSKPKASSASAAGSSAPSAPAPTPVEPADVVVTPEGSAPDAGSVTVEDLNRRGYLKDVFFDLDRAEVRGDQREVLDQNGAWLRKRTEVKIIIEGHCDERGTAQYNMALGERRAQTVTDYLVALGIAPSRIQVMSYGKERPFSHGHDDSSWAQNRRAHFVVTAAR